MGPSGRHVQQQRGNGGRLPLGNDGGQAIALLTGRRHTVGQPSVVNVGSDICHSEASRHFSQNARPHMLQQHINQAKSVLLCTFCRSSLSDRPISIRYTINTEEGQFDWSHIA